MPSAVDYTDPYLHIYRPVPPTRPGVCAVCHSGPGADFDVCHSCWQTMRQVTRPVRRVVPISLYAVPSQLWHMLRRYKDGPDEVARQHAIQIAATLSRFVERHDHCLASLSGGPFTLVTVVPSTRPTPHPEHPLIGVVKMVRRLRDAFTPILLRGAGAVGHNQASDGAFVAVRHLDGERILLVDDTLTSGARLQSAASTLYHAGAGNVTALVVGRVIKPDYNENCQRIWARATATNFSFDRCCLCN